MFYVAIVFIVGVITIRVAILLTLSFHVAQSINLTKLEVPVYADPRAPVELLCMWDLDKEPLQSVKWFRDDVEFLEYRPKDASYRSYPVQGISDQRCECDVDLAGCTTTLSVLPELNTAVYKCEVSGERPRFQVASGQKAMSVFASSGSQIVGLPSTVVPDTDIVLNCTTEPSLPISTITWFINDRRFDTRQHNLKHSNGLISSWSAVTIRINQDEVKYAECRTEQLGYGRQLSSERHRLAIAEHPVQAYSEPVEQSGGYSTSVTRSTIFFTTLYLLFR